MSPTEIIGSSLFFVAAWALFIENIMIISKTQVTDNFKGTAGEERRHGWSYWDGRWCRFTDGGF
jgi:hypothetical protein